MEAKLYPVKTGTLFAIFILILSLAPFGKSWGQVSITTLGSALTQDFNTLASSGTSSTLPTGWALSESGSSANTTYSAGNGSGNAGDTYSFGSAAADRSFGNLLSGSLTSTIGVKYANNSGTTITSLAISFYGEQWRLGATGRTDRLDFQYSTNATSLTTGTWTDVDNLDFTAPTTTGTVGALDGNLAANRTLVTFTITGLSISSGSSFWIRFNDYNAAGADDGLSIDDWSLTPSGTPTPLISTSVSSLSSFQTVTGTASAAQSYTVSGDYLTADVTVTAPAGFEVSKDNITYGSTATLTQTGGNLEGEPVTVYARIAAAASAGVYSGNITNASTGATTKNVAVTGTVLYPEPSNFPTLFSATANSSSQITTTWVDASAGQVPAGYLVKATVDPAVPTAPADGTAESDGLLVKNITQGTQQAVFTGLNSGTIYNFSIWPYTNSGTNIDYKLGTQPTATSTTCDITSKVIAPSTQTAAGDVSSTATSSGSAVDVFKFKISDLGTADGLSTKVTQVKIMKSTSSADWTDHIAGATLWDGASQITTGTVTITDADITFPITSGNLDVSNGSDRELTLKIWLKTTNIVDNSTMVFTVSQTSHGFTADATGSGFATDFGAGVTGNTMTVRVASTKLLFTTAPSATACPNTNLTTPPVVKATDANGTTDADYIGQITLTNSGGIGMTNYQLNASSGVATFTNLQFTATGNVTLSATASGLTAAGPTASISISVGNATSPAATNGNASSVITWTNPSSCIDEIMIVGKAGSAVSLVPTGNGTSYTANLAFGSGTGFDGGFVLYKGSTSSQTVTSLTNGTTYYFTLFTRKGTSWSSGVTTNATPVLSSSATDHFRSKVGDFWENTTTWESSVDGNTWIDATLTPTSSASSITIQSTGIVHLNSSLTVNRLIINSGGKLIIYNTRTLTIGNGSSAYDMDVMGTVECAGNIVVSNDGAAVKFESGSYYKHTGNGGTMVRATWDPNTTCEITGITNATVLTNIGNQNSAYGNLIWNCPGQTNWLYGTLSFDVAGDFIINSTGGANKGIDLVTATANRTFNIYGDLIINNGKLALTITEAIATLNISGNLTIAANSLNVLDMGWDNYSPNGGGNYRSIINLEGNLSVGSGATITTLGDGYGKIVFKKAGEQTYTNSGTITWVDYVINSGSTLKLASNLSLNSSASNAYTEVTVNGTINCGTYAVNESSGYYSLFTLNSNATLITANTGGVNGSLPVSHVDLYPDANYIFNGTANQVAGTLLTEAKNIDLSNTAGKVALSGNVAVSGTLTVPTGNTFDAGAYVISGLGDIDLQSGGTFMTSHPSGLDGNNTTTGGLTDFNSGANYTFYGTAAQVTGTQFPATVKNLTIDNSGGVSLSNPAVTVTNNLTINSGKLFNIDYNKQVNVNGSLINNGDETSLIIKSAAGGTGSLIHNTDNVKATIQRYITGNTNTGIYCYHFVSVPLVPSNNSLSGLFYDSYLWDFYEAENRWRAWGTPTTNILDETRGYIIYYRFAEFTYEFPGPINNGDFSADVTFTEQGASTNEGWNLVPNPYPSGLDWTKVSMSDRPNVEGGIYVWPADNDHSGETSSYYSYVGGVSTPLGALDGTIPVGQSVIVHANGSGTPAITFKNSHRVHASQSFLKSTKNTVPDLLYLIASDSTKSDQAAIRFLDEATENFDGEWDAYKLLGGQHTLNICSVSADGFKLAINSLPTENKDIIIPIYFYYTDSAKITIKASNLQSFDTVFPIYFEDKLLDKRVNLRDEDYTFEHHGDTVIDRFQIRFNITYGIDEKNLVDGRAFMLNGKLNIDIPEFENKKVSLQVLDLTGKTLLSGSMKLNGNTQTDLQAATGYYIVRVTDGRKQFVSKLLIH